MTFFRQAIQTFGGVSLPPYDFGLKREPALLSLTHSLSGLASPRQLPAEPPDSVVLGKARTPRRSASTPPVRVPRERSRSGARELESWTADKNRRRSTLIDKQIAGTLSSGEARELEDLQAEMLAFRRQVAPLPLDDLRALHQELLERASTESPQT